jgi:hypothetical protein
VAGMFPVWKDKKIIYSILNIDQGQFVDELLKAPLGQISRIAGQYGRIQGAYVEVENKFYELLNYAESRKSQNSNPNRKRYSILRYSCIHFVKEMTEVAGIDTPWMVDPNFDYNDADVFSGWDGDTLYLRDGRKLIAMDQIE